MRRDILLLTAALALGSAMLTGCGEDEQGAGPQLVERIELPGMIWPEPGQSMILPVSALPADAINKELRWFSTDTTVVRFNSDTREILALKVGQATLTAQAPVGGAFARCEVTVSSGGSTTRF